MPPETISVRIISGLATNLIFVPLFVMFKYFNMYFEFSPWKPFVLVVNSLWFKK